MSPENILFFSLAFCAFCGTLFGIYAGCTMASKEWHNDERMKAVMIAITYIPLSFALFSAGMLLISHLI